MIKSRTLKQTCLHAVSVNPCRMGDGCQLANTATLLTNTLWQKRLTSSNLACLVWTATSFLSQVKMIHSPQKPTAAMTVVCVSCDGSPRGQPCFVARKIRHPTHTPSRKYRMYTRELMCFEVMKKGAFTYKVLTFGFLNTNMKRTYSSRVTNGTISVVHDAKTT